jgi:hypothetical protein
VCVCVEVRYGVRCVGRYVRAELVSEMGMMGNGEVVCGGFFTGSGCSVLSGLACLVWVFGSEIDEGSEMGLLPGHQSAGLGYLGFFFPASLRLWTCWTVVA